MAIKIPPQLIIALVVVVVMVLVIFSFFAQTLFSGPELTAARDIAEVLDDACREQNLLTNFNVFLPDSKQGLTHREYFYIALSDYDLLLRARREAVDLKASFVDYVTGAPGERTLKVIELKNCKSNKVQICVKFESGKEKCDDFKFEANEGKESLTFTVNKTQELTGFNKLTLSYTRETICGDNVCSKPAENSTTCPSDCT